MLGICRRPAGYLPYRWWACDSWQLPSIAQSSASICTSRAACGASPSCDSDFESAGPTKTWRGNEDARQKCTASTSSRDPTQSHTSCKTQEHQTEYCRQQIGLPLLDLQNIIAALAKEITIFHLALGKDQKGENISQLAHKTCSTSRKSLQRSSDSPSSSINADESQALCSCAIVWVESVADLQRSGGQELAQVIGAAGQPHAQGGCICRAGRRLGLQRSPVLCAPGRQQRDPVCNPLCLGLLLSPAAGEAPLVRGLRDLTHT